MASESDTTEKPTDAVIREQWQLAIRIYRRGRPFGQRIALGLADALEASGVTAADIDRVMS